MRNLNEILGEIDTERNIDELTKLIVEISIIRDALIK